MILVTNLMRILPVMLIRGEISNTFLRSFLYYVPYVTLSIMTFPAIINASGNMLAGSMALSAGIFAAWRGANLFILSFVCCVLVFFVNYIH